MGAGKMGILPAWDNKGDWEEGLLKETGGEARKGHWWAGVGPSGGALARHRRGMGSSSVPQRNE